MSHQGTEVHAITAGKPVAQRAVGGGYFRIERLSYPVDVTLLFANGNPETYTGRKAGWKWRPGIHATENRRRFTGYIIESSETQSVTVDVVESADADMTPTDELTVIDVRTGRAVALRGEAFMAHLEQPADAALNSWVELWNPAGSEVNAILKHAEAYNSPSQSINVYRVDEKAVNLTTGVRGSKNFGNIAVPKVELIGGTAGLGASSVLRANWKEAFMPWVGVGKEIVIAPGTGIALRNSGVNAYIRSNFEWEEEEV